MQSLTTSSEFELKFFLKVLYKKGKGSEPDSAAYTMNACTGVMYILGSGS